MDAKIFGNYISRCRKELGMTQAELAEKLNVTDKAVSRWERGIGFPDISTLESLAFALKISVFDIMKSEESTIKTVKQNENETLRTFCITGTLLWPYSIYLTDAAIADIPDDMRKHVQDGGKLYIIKLLDDDKVVISISKHADDLCTIVHRSDVITKLRKHSEAVIATYPEEMKKHIESDGCLYMLGYPTDEDSEVIISTSKEANGYTMSVKYIPWLHDAETNFAEIGAIMKDCIFTIRRAYSEAKKKTAAYNLRNYLIYCTTIKELDELTNIYRNNVNMELITGYEPIAIANFVNALCAKYPKKYGISEKYLKHRNHIYAEIGAIMVDCICVIRDKSDNEKYEYAVKILRLYIEDCLTRCDIKSMTYIFKNKICDDDIGYDLDAVEKFANALVDEYAIVYK